MLCTERGNRYILIVVDIFIKHVIVCAMPNQEAVTIASVFLNALIMRFGVPYINHTDQGAHLKSHMFRELF